MPGDPLDQLPTIGAIDPDQVQRFADPAKPGKDEPGASRVRHRGGGDEHGHEHPQGIDQEVPFAAFDLFPTVIATFPTQFRRLDALAVEAVSGGMFVAAFLLAHLDAQGVVEALPGTGIAPLAEIPVHTGPLRILMREHPPFDAPVDDIKNGIDHRPHIQLAVAPTRLGWWDQIFDQIPFGISEVCGVWIGVHPQSVLN